MSQLAGWDESVFEAEGRGFPIFRKGTGPGVIVIHEIPGITPKVQGFAEEVVDAGFTVVMPSLFGTPGKEMSTGGIVSSLVKVCVSKEFVTMASGQTSPIATWTRALARELHEELGGPGVGALGMCFTGGFALAMMTEPSVVAPVLSQPSLPLFAANNPARAAGMNVSPAEIACARKRFADEDLSMIGLRFFADTFVPDARFDTYKREFGERFEAIEIDPKHARQDPRMAMAHSVLTLHLDDDDPGGPTKQAEARVIAFFKERTAG
jgi:dienelactone hydrolase